jgi:hypothetical protein
MAGGHPTCLHHRRRLRQGPLRRWVSRFGVPATITSDRGAQFTSALWAGLCSLLNIQHSPTTAYHPQSNGLVERFHRRLKDALRSRAAADWHDHIPWVLLGIRAAYREDSEFSPAEAVYGLQLILPGQFINTAESPSPSFLSELQTTMTGRPPPPARHNTAPAPATLPEELLLARFVLVRRDGAQMPLSPIYDGPYRVLERSTHFFLREMGDRTDKVSTLRLKAARTPADMKPEKPPRRGRPIAQAPPVRAPPPKQRGAAASGDFQPFSYNATNDYILYFSIRPPTSQCCRTVSTSEPAAAEFGGGPVVAHHLFLLCFPPRPSHDLLFLTHVVHM